MNRMEEEGQYHLLGLCKNDNHVGNTKILTCLASLSYLCRTLAENQLFQSVVLVNPSPLDHDDAKALSFFDLTPEDVQNAPCPDGLVAQCMAPDFEAENGAMIFEQLRLQLQSAMNNYRVKANSAVTEVAEIDKRKEDFTPAIHYWIKKLVEKHALQDLAKTTTNTNR